MINVSVVAMTARTKEWDSGANVRVCELFLLATKLM
jgi:hypothetical protein